VAVDHVVGVLLRQAVRENFEGASAVAGAGQAQATADRDALLVLDLRHEPGGVGLGRMHSHREAEH
jgi:hypothetical protein